MNGTTLPANIETAKTKAQQAATTAGQYASGQYSVGDIIKQKALDAYNASQDIVKPLDVATQSYLTAPQVAREKYQDIFNPFSREKLVAQYTGNQALPMLSLSSILGQRFGRIEDTIGAGTRAYQAQASSAQTTAEQARQAYTDLLSEYAMTKPKYDWLDLGTTKALVDESGKIIQQLPVTKFGNEEDATYKLLMEILSGGGGVQPTEAKPTYTPLEGAGAVSQNGEWYFVGSEYYPDDWIPIVD